jgi:uncharacterized protein
MIARLLAFLVALGLCGAAWAAPLERLSIETRLGQTRAFQVEIADTPATRERGLMFRQTMPADQGMLFDFKSPQDVGFWMENTYLPLDLIFIRADGRIARITRGEPFSRQILPSGEPVLAVLELNAGRSAALGIQPGDLVRHRIFKNVRPARRPAR